MALRSMSRGEAQLTRTILKWDEDSRKVLTQRSVIARRGKRLAMRSGVKRSILILNHRMVLFQITQDIFLSIITLVLQEAQVATQTQWCALHTEVSIACPAESK